MNSDLNYLTFCLRQSINFVNFCFLLFGPNLVVYLSGDSNILGLVDGNIENENLTDFWCLNR